MGDEPPADGPRRVPWGLTEPAVGFVAGLLGSSLGAAVWLAATGSTEQSLGLLTIGLFGLWSGYLATIVVTSRRRGSGSIVRDLGLRITGVRDLVVGLAAGLLSSYVLIPAIYALLTQLHLVDPHRLTDRLSEPAQRISAVAKGPGFIILWLLIGFGAPVVEELFFRGFLQPALAKRFGPPAAVVITALVFGAAHFEALQFPALAAFGAVLGGLAWRFDRLGPGIAAHMTFNTLTLIGLRLAR